MNPLWRLLALVLALVLVAAACGDDDNTTTAADDTTASDDEPATAEGTADDASLGEVEAEPTEDTADESVGETVSKPEVVIPAGEPPAELVSEDLVVGDGATAATGDFLTVNYVGVLFDDGSEFDNSYDRGQPFSFTLGTGGVIQGWDQGMVGMKVGGRRQLVIPSDLAYGDAGSGGGIPGGATLVFVVDLLSVATPATVADMTLPAEAPNELVISDLVVGAGAELTDGAIATVHYVGVALSTGETFDSSWVNGQTFDVQLGAGSVIPGFEQGLAGMREGGRRQIVIPPDLAYGEEGAGPGVIAPNETLVFLIDLLSVVPA